MRAGAIHAALPNHALRSTTSVEPSRRSFQRRCLPPSPPGHAVAVGLRCSKANTKNPRSSLKLDSASPRNNGGRSTLFSYQGGVAKISYPVPLPHRVYRTEPLSGGPFVAPDRSTVLEVVYRVCRPSSISRERQCYHPGGQDYLSRGRRSVWRTKVVAKASVSVRGGDYARLLAYVIGVETHEFLFDSG